MHDRRVIGIFLLFSAFIVLTTCQLQFNKSSNALTLRIVVPAASAGSRSTPVLGTNDKDLSGGTSVTVTITQGTTTIAQQTLPIGGNTSIDFSFVLPPPGLYQISAQLLDGSGNTLTQASTTFTVPTQTNPVVLTMPSNLFSAAITNYSGTTYQFTTSFDPTIYNYTSVTLDCTGPFSLALTTVDPSATITVIETDFDSSPVTLLNAVLTPTSCQLQLNTTPATITIVVTAPDGTTQTYTMTLPFSYC